MQVYPSIIPSFQASLNVESDGETSNYGNSSYAHDEDDDGVSTELSNLIQSDDWAGVLTRLASFPSEIRKLGAQSRTALHDACDNDAPAVVIQALLEAFPEASVMVGESHMTPLHITCSSQHASVHVVQMLLKIGKKEQTRMRDLDGDTPLHAACRCGAPIEVLELLLRHNPSACNERDKEGLTPIWRLWVRYSVILGNDVIDQVNCAADLTGELGIAWKKTELLLRCAHCGSLCQHGNLCKVVHAAAGVDCPRFIVRIAAVVYPRQLFEKDCNGLTPLLIASQAPIYKLHDLSGEGYYLEDVIYGDDPDSLGVDTELDGSTQPSVIEILLNANHESASSAACVPDPMGRLPLHLAVYTGKKLNQGVHSLIEVYPEALSSADKMSKLYPFMLAATGDRIELDVVYDLLRSYPTAISESRSR